MKLKMKVIPFEDNILVNYTKFEILFLKLFGGN